MNVSTIASNEGRILGVGRIRLHYRSWEAGRPRAAVVIVPGLADHSGRYENVGKRLASYGFSTFALDLRGHGLSEGRRGHADRFDCLLQDVDRFRREVTGLVDVHTPVFLLGHSMGGLIALRYQEEYESAFRGAIVISPWLATALPVPRWKATLAPAFARVLPAAPFRAHIDPGSLTREPDVVRAYREDPLVHDTITPRLFAEVSAAMGLALQRSERLTTPLLFLLAGDDRLVDTQRSLAFARSLAANDVTIRVYPECFHELLNEPESPAVVREIGDWIAERLD